MARRRDLLLALASTVMAGCGPRLPAADRRHLRSLRVDRAAEDARRAFARGDRRLLGIQGIGLYVPPRTLDHGEAERRFGFAPIPGTSDMLHGDEHIALQDNARRYALQDNARRYADVYNREILRLAQTH